MQKIRFLATALGACLASAVCSRVDIVTQPVRKFGLGDLLQVAISPDRQWMATAGSSGAFLWDFEAGNVVHRLEAHHARVSAISFSPDGEVLLTGGYDRVIRAWNVATGDEIRSYTGHLGSISDLAFSPDGQSFVSAGDNTARVWSLNTGDLLRTLTVPGASITRVLFAPNTNQLVTADGSLTNNVRVWDLSTGQSIRSFGFLVQELAFVAGGHLVTAGSDLAVQVWNIETGQVIRPLTGAAQIIIGLETSTNSALVIAGCHNGRVVMWDTSSGDIEHDFMGESLMSIAAIPGTNQILTGHPNNLVRVKNSEIGDNLRVFGGHTTSTTMGIGFSPDGRYIVSGGIELLTRLWTRTNAVPHTVVPGHADGRLLAEWQLCPHHVWCAHLFRAALESSVRVGRTRILRTHQLAVHRSLFARRSACCHGRSGWDGSPLGCCHRRSHSHVQQPGCIDSFRVGFFQWNVSRERRFGRNRPLVERHEWPAPAYLRVECRFGNESDVFARHRRIARHMGGWLSADI